MKTVRIREKIKKFLADGPRNTAEILEHINSTMRHGTTSQQLGHVLSKDKDIAKVGYINRSGILSGGYDIVEWATRIWVSDNCPGWEEGQPLVIDSEGNVQTEIREREGFTIRESVILGSEMRVRERRELEDLHEELVGVLENEIPTSSNYEYTFSDSENPYFGFLENIDPDWRDVLFSYCNKSILAPLSNPEHTHHKLQSFFNENSGFEDFRKRMVFLIRLGDVLLGRVATYRENSPVDNLRRAQVCYYEAIEFSKDAWKLANLKQGMAMDNAPILRHKLEPAKMIMVAYNNLGLAHLLLKDFDNAYECFETSRRYFSKMVELNLINSKSEGLKLQKLIDENMQLYWKLKPEPTYERRWRNTVRIDEKLYAPDEITGRVVLDNQGMEIGVITDLFKVKRTYRAVVVKTRIGVQMQYGIDATIKIPITSFASTHERLDEVVLSRTFDKLLDLPSYIMVNDPDAVIE